ncbi:MAG: DUF4388 domain-containing protein [bacterium]|nr:DUF4388 domain-containing protein [bacterium]
MANQAITLNGEPSRISIPQVFHAISISGATGIFTWHQGSRETKVYIHNGRIVFASSNQKTERLGEILVRRGWVRAIDYVNASGKVTDKRRLGQILIEMGSLSKDDIKRGVMEQVREIIYTLFNASEGEYAFQEQEKLPREVITLDMDTPELIMGGVKQISNWSLIYQTLGAMDIILEPASGIDQKRLDSVLSEGEMHIFELVNGERSVQQICRTAGGNDFETCRTLMGLLCANFIRRITDAEIAVIEEKRAKHFFSKTVRCYNRLFSYIYGYLGERVGKLGDTNLSHYLEEIKGDHAALLQGIFLLPDGTLAEEVLRENYEALPGETRRDAFLGALKGLLAAELAAVRESLGEKDAVFVTARLKGIMEKLKKQDA